MLKKLSLKVVLVVLISIITIFPNICHAENYTNLNGITMTEEEYNNFLKIHSKEYIMFMNEKQYEKLRNLKYDNDNIMKDTIYVQSNYNAHLDLVTEEVITEEEYNGFNPLMPMLDTDSGFSETSSKRLDLSVLGGSYYNYVTLTATWKGIPSTRSFDVIGIRGTGVSFRNGSQIGQQVYYLNDKWYGIDYDWNEDHITKYDNGFGFAMNIVNSDIDYLQLTAECDVTQDITHPSIYGSYQHAIKSVSLKDALNFTLNGSGLGQVFVYPYSISQKYDGMTGARIDY